MKTRSQKPKASGRRGVSSLKRSIGLRELTGTAVQSSLRIKSILVPIDFSEPSKKALAYAVPLAEQFGAKLTLLHVVEPVATPDFAKAFPLAMENEKVMELCQRKLEEFAKGEAVDPKSIEWTLVRYGHAFNEIADAARTLKADLIVISTHGYTGLKHALLGSTTERVVRYAPCPVLVVRENEREFASIEKPQPT